MSFPTLPLYPLSSTIYLSIRIKTYVDIIIYVNIILCVSQVVVCLFVCRFFGVVVVVRYFVFLPFCLSISL